MEDIRALTANAECSWAYIDRLQMALADTVSELQNVFTELHEVKSERDAAVKCLDKIREARVFFRPDYEVDRLLKDLRERTGL